MIAFNPIQPMTDACEWILTFWHDLIGDFEGSWGWSIILLTFTIRIVDPAAHVQGREVDAAAAGAPARDQVDPGALQGRQAAPEAGDHGLLPAREGQSAGVVPSAAAADPVLHRAVPAAALAGVQGGHRRQPRLRPDRQPRREGHRAGAARRADRPLCRHAAGRQRGHGDERRPDAAAHHVRAAVRLRRSSSSTSRPG